MSLTFSGTTERLYNTMMRMLHITRKAPKIERASNPSVVNIICQMYPNTTSELRIAVAVALFSLCIPKEAKEK